MSSYSELYQKNIPKMKRIRKWLDIIFPEFSNGPHWRQTEYKGDLFRIFQDVYSEDMPYGEMIRDYLKDNWREQPKNVWDVELWNILNAWDEWIYAVKNFSRK